MLYNYSLYQFLSIVPNINNKQIVYELVDPNTLHPRYVGITQNYKQRFYSHSGNENSNVYKRNWILSLKKQNKFFIMRIIAIFFDRKKAGDFEKEKIISKNIFTGDVTIFESCSSLRKNNFNYKKVKLTIKNKSLYKDCIWEYYGNCL